MSEPTLDPITGPSPSSLTLPVLAERLAMERALREQWQSATSKALELQALEYERRLEALNGEAGRLAKVLADSVPREVFDQYRDTQATAARIVADTLAEERGARAGGQRLIAGALFLIALASLILKFVPVGT